MKAKQLETNQKNIKLIEPNVDRDAPLSMDWLMGKAGEHNLLQMGVAPSAIKTTTFEAEKKRVQDFISKENQLSWLIVLNGLCFLMSAIISM